MTSKVYVITDLGPGDGGKGGVVHRLATITPTHTIFKRGGAQGSHGVRTAAGKSFAFSQWGCATFEGVRTHLTRQMVIHPEAMLAEAQALEEEGVVDPFSLISVDEDAICADFYNGVVSRVLEISLGDNPRGTIGTGVGVAYRLHTKDDAFRLYAKELQDEDRVREHLEKSRWFARRMAHTYLEDIELSEEDTELLAQDLELLHSDDFVEACVQRLLAVSEELRVMSTEEVRSEILSQEGSVVVETSHGVLTDAVYGLNPHTSAIRTLPAFTKAMFRDEYGYQGEMLQLGVCRAYAIRHGAGPLPTHDEAMTEQLLPGSNKLENRFQGKVRVGPMDMPLLRYAMDVCGGPEAFDGLALTWCDQVLENGSWTFVDSYNKGVEVMQEAGVDRNGQVSSIDGLDTELFTSALKSASGPIEAIPLDGMSHDQLFTVFECEIQERLGIPLRMMSVGPTEKDKICV